MGSLDSGDDRTPTACAAGPLARTTPSLGMTEGPGVVRAGPAAVY